MTWYLIPQDRATGIPGVPWPMVKDATEAMCKSAQSFLAAHVDWHIVWYCVGIYEA